MVHAALSWIRNEWGNGAPLNVGDDVVETGPMQPGLERLAKLPELSLTNEPVREASSESCSLAEHKTAEQLPPGLGARRSPGEGDRDLALSSTQ